MNHIEMTRSRCAIVFSFCNRLGRCLLTKVHDDVAKAVIDHVILQWDGTSKQK